MFVSLNDENPFQVFQYSLTRNQCNNKNHKIVIPKKLNRSANVQYRIFKLKTVKFFYGTKAYTLIACSPSTGKQEKGFKINEIN